MVAFGTTGRLAPGCEIFKVTKRSVHECMCVLFAFLDLYMETGAFVKDFSGDRTPLSDCKKQYVIVMV